MRRKAVLICGAVFVLLCVGTVWFLRLFMTADPPYLYLTWTSAQRVEADGTLSPPVEDPLSADLADGGLWRLSAEASDIPADGYLRLNCAGLELTVRLDGEEVFRSAASLSYGSQVMGEDWVMIPLPPGQTSCRVEVDLRVLDPDSALYPPLGQVSSNWLTGGDTMAYANLYSIPAGGCALVFLLVCGLFLLSAAAGRPNASLLVLALAAGLLAAYGFNRGCGFYFLPPWLNSLLNWRGFGLLIPALLVLYLVLGRRRGFLRLAGRIALWGLGAVAAASAVSALCGGPLYAYLRSTLLPELRAGYYDNLLYWCTLFLAPACAGISAYDLARILAGTLAEARTLKVKNQLTLKSYQESQAKAREMETLRHEWKNQVAALDLLCQAEDWAGLRRQLAELEGRLARLSPRVFAAHPAINALLQSAAARAESLGVAFHAQVLVPERLRVDEGDLCTLLLNMLDNAVDAAAGADTPPGREVCCRLHLTQGFLAIRCENTYSGQLDLDSAGLPRTTRPDPVGHGLGLRQMRAVAEKYHSVLDIQYTADRFTVQTALKLPAEAEK